MSNERKISAVEGVEGTRSACRSAEETAETTEKAVKAVKAEKAVKAVKAEKAEKKTKHRILAIVGPTGGGKSALALRLARDYGGVIISCDSMQVYRRMDVGTAKPTADEQRLVCHRMIDLVEPHEDYSCAQYVAGAAGSIQLTAQEGRLPIVCGGTGLYLDALLRERELPEVEVPDGLRNALREEALRRGAHEMWLELFSVDPESASSTHENNEKRVLRP